MKKLLFFWSLLAIAIGFTACNNDDPNFEFDEEGRCFLPNVSPISHATFLKYAEGNGWKHVSTYEINQDGSVQSHDHYRDLTGGGPSSYYFEKGHLYQLFLVGRTFCKSILRSSLYLFGRW